MSKTRYIFRPPAVEPAQPPANAVNTITTVATGGQAAWSVVVNPVVVAIDTAWNRPSRSGAEVDSGAMAKVATTMPAATVNTPRYKRNSESRA